MKVSDKKKRTLVGLMFKSVTKRTWLMVAREKAQWIKTIRRRLEEVISTLGHYVQFVGDGENSFIYTAGRNDKDKPDFVAGIHVSQSIGVLVNEVVKRYDQGNMALDTVYESETLVTAVEPSQPTKFKLVQADIDAWRPKALGLFNRYKGEGVPKILEIVVADRHNNF